MLTLHALLSLLVAILMSVGILWPFFSEAPVIIDSDGDSELTKKSERRERAMLALEELARDYASGKMTEEAYQASRAEISQEVARFSD